MLIALPMAPLPHAVLITSFTQSANVTNRLHISALGEDRGALCVAVACQRRARDIAIMTDNVCIKATFHFHTFIKGLITAKA